MSRMITKLHYYSFVILLTLLESGIHIPLCLFKFRQCRLTRCHRKKFHAACLFNAVDTEQTIEISLISRGFVCLAEKNSDKVTRQGRRRVKDDDVIPYCIRFQHFEHLAPDL